MAAGNIRSIGAIVFDFRNPSLRWTSAPTNHGFQPCSISGTIEMLRAQQLSELVNNPAAQTTKGGYTGVEETIEMDGDAVGPFKGDYLLQSFEVSIDQSWAAAGQATISIAAVFVGPFAP